MSAHTPGPWIAKSDDGRYNNSRNTWRVDDEEACCSEAAPITLGDGTVIAFAVASDDDYFADNRVDANANLIAAAPELLDALIEAVDCGMVPISSAKDGGASTHSRQVRCADMIRAAIAKATGGAE